MTATKPDQPHEIARRKHMSKTNGHKVWVVQLDWYGPEPDDYAGWISVHRTEAGAQKRLEQRAAEFDLDLAAIDSGEDTSGSTYSKSYLTLED